MVGFNQSINQSKPFYFKYQQF